MTNIVNTFRFVLLIVSFTVILSACKSKKVITSDHGLEELHTKFERLYIEACTQHLIGNNANALSQFSKCADIRPDEASVYYQISRIKQELNEDHAAFHNASKANSIAPSNKFYALHYTTFLKSSGDYTKALEVLEFCLNANPKDESLYNAMDAIYEIQNETAKRIALWLRYKDNVGLKVKTGQKLIALYKIQKDYTSMHKLYDELKRAAPNKTQFYLEDAKLYEEQKDYVNANINYERAIENNPNNWEVNYALYNYYSTTNNLPKAEYYLKFAFEKSIVEFESKIPACQQLLRQTKTDTNQCRFAYIAATGLINAYPLDAKALFTAAELNNSCGNFIEGEKYYKAACNINPNLFDAWTGLLKCGIILKHFELCISEGERAIEYFPNTVVLYEYVAKSCNLNYQYEKAFEYAVKGESMVFEDSEKSNLLYQKGLSLYFLKKYPEAIKVIEYALTIKGEDPELLDLAGNTYFYLSNESKAIEYWQKAKLKGSVNTLLDKKIRDKKVYD